MRIPDHPARRPTRYHWAAGLNPLHWGPALAGWTGMVVSGSAAAAGEQWGAAASLLFAAGSLAWSGLWLAVIPSSKRFKRAVDARNEAQYEFDYSYQLASLTDQIHPDLFDKVDDITRLRDKARGILEDKFGDSDPFAVDNLEKLDKLAISYLQLLAALSEYDDYLSLVDPDSIEHELDAAKEALEDAGEEIRGARQRTVSLLSNRLDRYRKAKSRMELIQAQCRNVGTTLKLIIDQAMTAKDPQRVGTDIDQVLENIKESEILSAELSAFNELEANLDDQRFGELE